MLAGARYDHDKQRLIIPKDEKAGLTERDFHLLTAEYQRRENEFLRAREDYELALGALSGCKVKIQKQRNYSPYGDFD